MALRNQDFITVDTTANNVTKINSASKSNITKDV